MIFLAKLLKYQDYRKQNYRIRSMGIILIGFNVDWIEERISTSELTEETQIFIAECEGKVVYSNSKSNALTEESVHELLQDTASGESVYREYDRDLYLVQRNELGHGLVMYTWKNYRKKG